jgi:glycosyltransferase involved in cell wall biosynthesis
LNGRRYLERNFSREQVAGRLLDLLSEMTGAVGKEVPDD